MGGGILAKLLIKLGLDKKEFDRGIDGAKKKTSAFGSAVKKLGGLLIGVFAVNNVVNFGKELLRLGGIAEGVSSAFSRIADQSTLEDLKEATRGTVSELELMQRAVQAGNFGIPIKNLASLFEFATKRAQDTGQSVDYLVDSLVMGIGMKSRLRLDNLGITITQLNDKFKELGLSGESVGDFAAAAGSIAQDAMEKTGGIIDTNNIKIQNLAASWENFKLSVATNKAVLDSFSDSLSKTQQWLFVVTSDSATLMEKWAISLDLSDKRAEKIYNQVKKRDEATRERNKKIVEQLQAIRDENAKANGVVEESIPIVKQTQEEWDKLNEEYNKAIDLTNDLADTLDEATKKINENGDAAEEWIQTWISASDEVGKATGEIADNVASMFGDEAEEDLGFDTEGYLKSLDDFNAFKEDFKWAVVDFGTSVVDELGNAFGELAATGEFPEDFGKNVLSIIGSFISMLGKMLIGLGVASEAFQLLLASAFTNPVSAALAIAAGAGLVLLGGAIQGAAKAGPTGNSVSASGGYSSTSGGYQASTPQQDNKVVFELQGTKLIGVINNTNRVNSITR